MRGQISDRLRARLRADDPQWNPERVTAQTDDMPARLYRGVALGRARRTAAAR